MNDNEVFDDMANKRLITFSNSWIEKAVEQKNPHLTLDLANSRTLSFDRLDEILLAMGSKN